MRGLWVRGVEFPLPASEEGLEKMGPTGQRGPLQLSCTPPSVTGGSRVGPAVYVTRLEDVELVLPFAPEMAMHDLPQACRFAR